MFANVTKMCVTEAISLVVARQVRDLIIDNTDVDPDSITLRVGSLFVGGVAASKVKPHTDRAVDNAAAWIASKRNKKEATDTE